jgi:hypothetical protein
MQSQGFVSRLSLTIELVQVHGSACVLDRQWLCWTAGVMTVVVNVKLVLLQVPRVYFRSSLLFLLDEYDRQYVNIEQSSEIQVSFDIVC